MINNTYLNKFHKEAISFFLKHLDLLTNNEEKPPKDLLQQINNSVASVESTPYYCIIKFYHDGFTSNSFDKTINLQVLNEHSAPAMFHMHFNRDLLVEFEYYKADSSIINTDELLFGKVIVETN